MINLKINYTKNKIEYCESIQLLKTDYNKIKNIVDKSPIKITASELTEKNIIYRDYFEYNFYDELLNFLNINTNLDIIKMLKRANNEIEKIQNNNNLNYQEKYKDFYTFMKNEELPEKLNEFCEFIIQQNASDADKYFKAYPEVGLAFLDYFVPTEGKTFYRGGYENLDRTFLCSSNDLKVARNFALYGNNFNNNTKSKVNGKLMIMTSDKHYKTIREVDGEEEVLLWQAKVIDTLSLQ